MLVTPAYSTTITTYSSLASWQAAASGVQTIDFEGMSPAGSSQAYGSGILVNGVQFIGITGSSIGVMDTSAYSWANYHTNDAAWVLAATPSFRITLPTGVTAFGLNLFTSNTQLPIYTVAGLGTPVSVPTFTLPTPAFFGVTSDTPIPSVDFTLQITTGNYALFDNVQWGTAQVTTQAPEAGTCLLIGSGLIGLAIFRKRRSVRRS
jgi:hypothetical protein